MSNNVEFYRTLSSNFEKCRKASNFVEKLRNLSNKFYSAVRGISRKTSMDKLATGVAEKNILLLEKKHLDIL